MRRTLLLLVVAALVAVPVTPAAAKRRFTVVASFYPLAWAAQQVGGDGVRVTDLTPPGGEPHDLELSPDDRDAIETADLVIVLGGGFQPAVEKAAKQRDRGKTLVIVDAFSGIRRRALSDPHVWLDLEVMKMIAIGVAAVLHPKLVSTPMSFPTKRFPVIQRLAVLRDQFETGLANCDRRLIVTSHAAFGWLASAYGLKQKAIAGIDPESEPSPRRLDELADLVKKKGVTTIFTEDLVSPKVAKTLAREAGGVRTAVLSPLESLTKEQRKRGDDYLDVMRENLSQLRRALGCS